MQVMHELQKMRATGTILIVETWKFSDIVPNTSQ